MSASRVYLILCVTFLTVLFNSLAWAVNSVEELRSAPISDISPSGKLKDLFEIPSKYTDLQRDTVLKDVKGKVIQWNLFVYEVERDGLQYKIITSGNENVSCSITLIALSDSDRGELLSMKTGDIISIKGVLTGETGFRTIKISPAILYKKDDIKNNSVTCYSENYSNCINMSEGVTSNMADCIETERKKIQSKIESLYQSIVSKQNAGRNEDLKKATQAWKKYREDMSGFLYEPDDGSAAKIRSLGWMLEETNRFCVLLKGQANFLQ